MKPSRILDSHQHVFWHGRDDRGLIADMDEQGIERALLLTWEIASWDTHPDQQLVLNPAHLRFDGFHPGIPLSDLVLARDRYPDRFWLGYCPHPMVGNPTALLRAAHKMYGLKACGEWKFILPFDDARCIELFRVAGELGLPVVLHLDVPYLLKEGVSTYQPMWFGGTVDNLEHTLAACPATNFIGHAPGFWREMGEGADMDGANYPRGPVTGPGKLYRLFENYPNLYADLSANSGLYALKRDPEHAVRFINTFADRLLFGRDYYGGDLHTFLQTLDLSAEVTEKLYSRNLEALLSL